MTPVERAASAGEPDIVTSLIRHAADVKAFAYWQSLIGCEFADDIVRILVENGADINLPGVDGSTSLMSSVSSADLCQFLIERGASVNAVNDRGNTALHWAIQRGWFDTVRLLMEHGADTSLCNDEGDDALQCAALFGRADIVEHLVEELEPTSQRLADVYSLIGATFVVPADYDVDEDAEQGLAFWIKSANILTQNLTEDPVRDMSLGPNPAYIVQLRCRSERH